MRHERGLREAEVDFADVWVRIGGEMTKCRLFTLRLSFSGKAIHRVFKSEAQDAFLEGHVEAFRALGGVPARHIRYDNLKPAVNRVCFGRNRVKSQRWVAFRSHYGFEAFYCIPGQEGAHEKGGVEQEGGRFRRTHLVPVPEVTSLTRLNEMIAGIDLAEEDRVLHGQRVSVGFNFHEEADLLEQLPFDDFDCGVTGLGHAVYRLRAGDDSVVDAWSQAPQGHLITAGRYDGLDRAGEICKLGRLSRRRDFHAPPRRPTGHPSPGPSQSHRHRQVRPERLN